MGNVVVTVEEPRLERTRPVQRVATSRAVVEFYAPAPAALVSALSIDPGIGAFWRYSEAKRQKGVLEEIASAPDGHVSLAVADGKIVGYVLLCRPGPLERWCQVPGVYELSIEVSRGWRQLGIAHRLLHVTFADPLWETRVAVSQGYSWHWDIEYNGMAPSEYREMFRRLFETYGFAVFDTDDPEIFYEKTNILMARVGTACPSTARRGFYEDLYRTRCRPTWLQALLATT